VGNSVNILNNPQECIPRRREQASRTSLWAISAYYNPLGWRSRRRNYDVFRKRLAVPLLTVELTYGERSELADDDADIVVRLRGESILWQKERLLNVGLKHLPKEVQHVAWLDCDIVFAGNDWPERASRLLETTPIVQLFDHVHDLAPGMLPSDALPLPDVPSGYSIAHLINSGSLRPDDLRPLAKTNLRRTLCGLAWAAQRPLLEKHGFYDVCILGGGDRVMAYAAYGRLDDAIFRARLDPKRAAHYLGWARPYYDSIRGNVGCLDGYLYHLWHGDIKNRKYFERHLELSTFSLDPATDLMLDDQGCWRWTARTGPLQDYVRSYFVSRSEDDTGSHASTQERPGQ